MCLLSVTFSAVLVIEFPLTGKDVERQDLADSSVGNLVDTPTCEGVFMDDKVVKKSVPVLLSGIQKDKSFPGGQISILNTAVDHIGVDLSNYNSHGFLRVFNIIGGLVVVIFDAVN